MQLILDRLLAEMNIMQEKTEAGLKKIKAEIRANNVKFDVLRGPLVAQINIHEARALVNQREMVAKMDAWIERTEVYVGKLKPNREKSDAVEEHQEAPNEETEVERVGALKVRFEDRHLAVEYS
jgi:hypothetical protein